MKLRHFLDAGYAILLEEYQRYRMSLPDALDQLREYSAGYDPQDEKPKVKAEVSANDQAMSELRTLFANTGIPF